MSFSKTRTKLNTHQIINQIEPKNGDYQAGGVRRGREKYPWLLKKDAEKIFESEKPLLQDAISLCNEWNWMQRLH